MTGVEIDGELKAAFQKCRFQGRRNDRRLDLERLGRAHLLLQGASRSQVLGHRLLASRPWQPMNSLANPIFADAVGRELTACARAQAPDAKDWHFLSLSLRPESQYRFDCPADEALSGAEDVVDHLQDESPLENVPFVGWLRFDFDPMQNGYGLRLDVLAHLPDGKRPQHLETNMAISGVGAAFDEVRRLQRWTSDIFNLGLDFGSCQWVPEGTLARKRILAPMTGAPARRLLRFLDHHSPKDFIVDWRMRLRTASMSRSEVLFCEEIGTVN